MDWIYQAVIRKYEQYFLKMKNNRFSPHLFYEAMSLINAKYDTLKPIDCKNRFAIIRTYLYDYMVMSLSPAEEKTEFLQNFSADYALRCAEIHSVVTDFMYEDEHIMSKYLYEHKEDEKEDAREIIYPDIRQKWGVGIAEKT